LNSDAIIEQVSVEMNNDLWRDFTNEQILDTLFQIGRIKALGPDGFWPIFIREIGSF
jgi:hypothetical protein